MNRVESTMSCIGGILFYFPIPMDRINPNGSNPNPNTNQPSVTVKDDESQVGRRYHDGGVASRVGQSDVSWECLTLCTTCAPLVHHFQSMCTMCTTSGAQARRAGLVMDRCHLGIV